MAQDRRCSSTGRRERDAPLSPVADVAGFAAADVPRSMPMVSDASDAHDPHPQGAAAAAAPSARPAPPDAPMAPAPLARPTAPAPPTAATPATSARDLPTGPGAVRASDADRQAVVDQLSRATGEGRLTLEEFADASGTAYAAITRSDLESVVRPLQLPDVGTSLMRTPDATPVRAATAAQGAEDATVPAVQPTTTRRRWVVAIMSSEDRRGRWRIGQRTGAFALMGGVDLDLRNAVLDGDVIEITAWAIMGGVDVIVPEGIPVESSGFMLMGGRKDRVKDVPSLPGAPVIRVRGFGFWGGVTVRSRPSCRPDEPETAGEVALDAGQGALGVAHRALSGPHQPPLGDAPGQTHPPPTPSDPASRLTAGHLVTVVSTDIVGSTRYADVLGDQGWRQVLLAHNALVRDQVARHHGTEVKTSGDGFLLTFAGARSALHFAVGLQDALAEYREAHPDSPIEVRIGVHTGEVERDGDDIIGRNVTIACRLCDVAAPGEVLASAVVADLADSASDLGFGAGREHRLAGIERPVTARAATRR